MSDNYPEGVTARNIDRLDHDEHTKDRLVSCKYCDFEGWVDAFAFADTREWAWECPKCLQPGTDDIDDDGDN
jgi:hypothetical protein